MTLTTGSRDLDQIDSNLREYLDSMLQVSGDFANETTGEIVTALRILS